MVARGQASVIDALGALLVSIAILSAAIIDRSEFNAEIDEIAEKEYLRREFYILATSGNMTRLLHLCANQGSLDLGGIRLSLQEPDLGPYVTVLSIREGGMMRFYITRKE